MNELLTSSEETLRLLNRIIEAIKEKIPSITYKKGRYWVSLKSPETQKNFVYFHPQKHQIRLFTPLDPFYDRVLKPAPSTKGWLKELPSIFIIKSDEDIERAINLIIASYEKIRAREGYVKIKPKDNEQILNYKRKYRGAEGEGHKRLKEWIAENAWFIGLKNVNRVEVETHIFPSGDTPDLVFHYEHNKYAVVEIETDNPIPGAYQALKYKFLLIAEMGLPLDSSNVRSILVAWTIPPDVQRFCEKYGIDYKEMKI